MHRTLVVARNTSEGSPRPENRNKRWDMRYLILVPRRAADRLWQQQQQ